MNDDDEIPNIVGISLSWGIAYETRTAPIGMRDHLYFFVILSRHSASLRLIRNNGKNIHAFLLML